MHIVLPPAEITTSNLFIFITSASDMVSFDSFTVHVVSQNTPPSELRTAEYAAASGRHFSLVV